MPDPSSFAGTVDHAMSRSIPTSPPAGFEPPEARATRQDGAIVVTSDGASVRVELSDPIRLSASDLAAEVTSAANEALASAQQATLAALGDGAGTDVPGEIDALRRELVAAYDDELRRLDERIERLAAR